MTTNEGYAVIVVIVVEVVGILLHNREKATSTALRSPGAQRYGEVASVRSWESFHSHPAPTTKERKLFFFPRPSTLYVNRIRKYGAVQLWTGSD